MNKIFAIGDIHGCLDQLQELVKTIGADKQQDTLVFIGDYIDRGKFAKEVVDYVISIRNEFKNVVCLMGNHEMMFLNYLDGIDETMYLYNGGTTTLFSYGIFHYMKPAKRVKAIPEEHLLFYKSLLPYYETENYIFVHAGLIPRVLLGKQSIHDLLWVRQEFVNSDYNFGKVVVFGHTPLSSPLIRPNKIGIDTGAVFNGKLTCVELPAVKIHQV